MTEPSPIASRVTRLGRSHRWTRAAGFLAILPAIIASCDRLPPTRTSANTPTAPASVSSVDEPSTDVATSSSSGALPVASAPSSGSSRPADPPAPTYPPGVIETLRTRLSKLVGPDTIRGASWSAIVIEAASGFVVFEANADRALVPASNTKLFTCGAALRLLGADHTMRTRWLMNAEPSADGSVDDLYLVGEHDPSWAKLMSPQPDAALKRLAAAAKARGVRKVKQAVHVLGEPLWEPARFHELEPDKHRAEVASHLALALRAAGIQAGAYKTSKELDPPTSAVLIAEEKSPPLAKICEPIGQLSHNEMADALSRHLGFVRSHDSSYNAGTAATIGWLKSEAIDSTISPTQLVDGSGLSRGNHVSARTIASLLRWMTRSDSATIFEGTLAVAGEKGTLARRMKGPLLKGRFRGKTGTLEGVVATSGYLDHPTDGHRYIVALITNDVRDSQLGRGIHDRIANEIAGGWSTSVTSSTR